MIVFKTLELEMPSGEPGEESPARTLLRFDAPVHDAVALLRSWQLGFRQEDHHLRDALVRVAAEVDPLEPRLVEVEAAVGLRDDGMAPGCCGKVEALVLARGAEDGDCFQRARVPVEGVRGELALASRRRELRFDFEPMQYEAGLAAWHLGFADQDHHVHDMAAEVDLLPAAEGPDHLSLEGRVGLGDVRHDDPYRGEVSAAVIALPEQSGLLLREAGRLELRSRAGSSLPVPGETVVDFGQPLVEAEVFLKGWHLEFPEGEDHHLQSAQVKLTRSLDPRTPGRVQVGAWLELEDRSGERAYQGWVDVAVIGRVQEAAGEPGRAAARDA